MDGDMFGAEEQRVTFNINLTFISEAWSSV